MYITSIPLRLSVNQTICVAKIRRTLYSNCDVVYRNLLATLFKKPSKRFSVQINTRPYDLHIRWAQLRVGCVFAFHYKTTDCQRIVYVSSRTLVYRKFSVKNKGADWEWRADTISYHATIIVFEQLCHVIYVLLDMIHMGKLSAFRKKE